MGEMSKDPAFLFYSNDFLSGVADLTMHERGQYITLLCVQHQKGRLSRKAIELVCENVSADVLAKFHIDDDGCYYNPRLEAEMEKRKAKSQAQRDRAFMRWRGKDSEPQPPVSVANSDQFPKQENTMTLSIDEINMAREYYRLTTRIEPPDNQTFADWFEAFKLQNFTGKKFYQDRRDIVRHFREWTKFQKPKTISENGRRKNIASTENIAGANYERGL